jgi:adenylate cyclase
VGLADEIDTMATTAIWTDWKPRKSSTIPKTADIGLTTGDAVRVDATWLYADLRDSSGLVQRHSAEVAATCIGAFLRCASHIIRQRKGAIRSFDGDRVMGIFQTANSAVLAGQQICGAVEDVLRPSLNLRFPQLTKSGGWYADVGIGVAWGEALMVRGGVRGNNDLVSVGAAANIAAKLSDVRSGGKSIFITSLVHTVLDDAQRYANGVDMWELVENQVVGGKVVSSYGSGWYKRLP